MTSPLCNQPMRTRNKQYCYKINWKEPASESWGEEISGERKKMRSRATPLLLPRALPARLHPSAVRQPACTPRIASAWRRLLAARQLWVTRRLSSKPPELSAPRRFAAQRAPSLQKNEP